MKVLVTGGCGFLGSHVCEFFKNKGWSVISVDNMTKYELNRTGFIADDARKYNWNFLKSIGVELIKDDVKNYESMLEYSKDVDFIIHTAAQPAMTISWEDPDLDFVTNTLGTFNMLKVARERDIKIVTCASVHVYGNSINDDLIPGNNKWIREEVGISEIEKIATGNLSPLHASKCSGDLYTKAFIDSFKLKAASFRLTGIYGTRQFGGEDHGWVANFVIRAVTGRQINIFGNGWQVRDIIYAEDVCEAFLKFYEAEKYGIYNIGGGEKTMISLLNSIDIISKILGKKINVNFDDDRFGDLRYFVCNISKAKSELNWNPKILPENGIKRLAVWVQENLEIFDAKKQ